MRSYLLLSSCITLLLGCSSDQPSEQSQPNTQVIDTSGNESSDFETAKPVIFPHQLMVASPFADLSGRGQGVRSIQYAPTPRNFGPSIPAYFAATEQIDAVLNGELSVSDALVVRDFYHRSPNADCFGPQLVFSDHPEAGGGASSGILPSGDLGLWLASDSTGNACSVAQTNALLSGVEKQTQMALVTLASLISAADSEGEDTPEEGESLDLTTAMNAQGIADANFTQATLSRTATDWVYEVILDYTVSSSTYQISLTMVHTPDTDSEHYQGSLQMQIEGENGVSGIELPGLNCPQAQRTLGASLAYSREEDDLSLQMRNATLCGHNVSGLFNSEDMLDSDNTYQASSNPDGWSENFSIFGAELDITSLAGSYAYVWQAGMNDSHSRVFNIGVNDPNLDNGEAHFGYGEQVTDTDGSITGFICNWAGPGSSHSLVAKTQRQFFEYDSGLGIYIGTDHRANIEYAPTTSCDYDGSGSFLFDIDLSGTLGDSSLEDSSLVYSNDLWTPSDSSLTIAQAIAARGLTIPSTPKSWPKNE